MSPDPGIRSKVSGKLSGLAKRADMLGAIVGYLGTFATANTAEGGNYFSMIVARHVNAVKIHNISKLGDIPNRLANDPNWGQVTMGGIAEGIVGLIGSYLPSVVPWQGSVCSIAKKVGFGAAVGGGLALIVSELSEGSGGSTIDGSPSSRSSGAVSTTGMVPRPTGAFAPPTPYVGTWSRPR